MACVKSNNISSKNCEKQYIVAEYTPPSKRDEKFYKNKNSSKWSYPTLHSFESFRDVALVRQNFDIEKLRKPVELCSLRKKFIFVC